MKEIPLADIVVEGLGPNFSGERKPFIFDFNDHCIRRILFLDDLVPNKIMEGLIFTKL